MKFNEMKQKLFKQHGITKNKDIARFFKVTDQAVSNWKRIGEVPEHYIALLKHRRTDNNIDAKTIRMLFDLLNAVGDNVMNEWIKKVLFEEKRTPYLKGRFLAGENIGVYRVWVDKLGGDWSNILENSNEILNSKNFVKEYFHENEETVMPIRWKMHEYIGTKINISERKWLIKRKDGEQVLVNFRIYVDFDKCIFTSVVLDYDVLDGTGDVRNRLTEERHKELGDLLLSIEDLHSRMGSSS
jgi:hypothetical protein